MRRDKPVNNEVYHIYNRGVEKRKIFLNDQDRFRFIHDLYEFNDKKPAFNLTRRIEVGLRSDCPREILVEIFAYCMMPNHFHLMLRQIADNGITKFMHKLGTGYTNYFNKKYERVGCLFQGKYKATHIQREDHYIHLPYYVHFNPLKLFMPNWKEQGVADIPGALAFLENYRWSSHLDYLGIKNFPSLINKEFIDGFLGGHSGYKQRIREWLEKPPEEFSEVGLQSRL